MNKDDLIVVCGAGGFLGGHLIGRLIRDGYTNIRAVGRRSPATWVQRHEGSREIVSDLTQSYSCETAVRDAQYVFNLAANVGGISFIKQSKVNCMMASLINTRLLQACADAGVKRYFYASSACVYQDNVAPNYESDAYPANPEPGYGWEKIWGEQLCQAFTSEGRLDTRIGRFFTLYGPRDANKKGKDHAPMALCRKFAEAKLLGRDSIEIHGRGDQIRSFLYVDDAVEGALRMMNTGYSLPVNLGNSEGTRINQLVDLLESLSGFKPKRIHNTDVPTGVRCRLSENGVCKSVLGWEPETTIKDGMDKTWRWAFDVVRQEIDSTELSLDAR